jgi:hypothetical protein
LVKQQITAKQNIINKATTLKQYELCDKTQDEMRDLLKQKGKLENQLKEFQKKDTKSKWYQKKKEVVFTLWRKVQLWNGNSVMCLSE